MNKELKMKKLISIIAMLLCSAMLFCGCQGEQDPNAPEGYKVASSDAADYVLCVPEEWIVETSTLYTSAYFSRGADATSISVTAFGADIQGQTVEGWWEGYSEEFAATFSSFEVVSEEDAALDGIDGKKYTFTATIGKSESSETAAEGETAAAEAKQYNFICHAVVKDTYVYYLLYTSTPEYYEEHIDELNEVITNFKFK